MTILTIDWNRRRQTIDGFGVHGAFRQAANLMRYDEQTRERALDLLFATEGDGCGFSIVRNIIGDSGEWGTPTNGPTRSIEPQPGTTDLTGDEDQLWFMRQARQRGCETFVSTAWSPPAWMKTNADVANGGSLRTDRYRDFAEYLARYVQLYRDAHGMRISAISPANEPEFSTDYSSCLWSSAELATFYREHLAPVWEREGLDTRIFGPETTRFDDTALDDYRLLLDDPVADARLDIVAMHGYENIEVARPDDRVVRGRRLWMTELCDVGAKERTAFDASIEDALTNARRVHDYLTAAECNAFIYFWGVSCLLEDNSSLIGLDLASMALVISRRLHALGNYSRFVRPGSVRYEAAVVGASGLSVSAFRDPDGRAIIVVINPQPRTVSITLPDPAGPWTPFITDRAAGLAEADPVASAAVLGPQSVTTFLSAELLAADTSQPAHQPTPGEQIDRQHGNS